MQLKKFKEIKKIQYIPHGLFEYLSIVPKIYFVLDTTLYLVVSFNKKISGLDEKIKKIYLLHNLIVRIYPLLSFFDFLNKELSSNFLFRNKKILYFQKKKNISFVKTYMFNVFSVKYSFQYVRPKN